MLSFSKKNNLYDFYRDSYILLRDWIFKIRIVEK
jgi:hypothetical protein